MTASIIRAFIRSKTFQSIETLVPNGLALSVCLQGNSGIAIETKVIFNDQMNRSEARKLIPIPVCTSNHDYNLEIFENQS